MDSLSIVLSIISGITTILSITFAILAFNRNKSKDNTDLESRLTRIETDILYIRQNLDNDKEWRKDIEHRVLTLEQHDH